MAFSFEKLLVYQKAVDFFDAHRTPTERFPRGHEFLIDSLNRGALLFDANVANGNRRFALPAGKHLI